MSLNIKKVLVPTGFSETSIDALCYASSLCEKTGGEIILLNVLKQISNMMDIEGLDKIDGEIAQKIESKLEELKKKGLNLHGVKVSTRIDMVMLWNKLPLLLTRRM